MRPATHPDVATIALLAGGELTGVERLRAAWHVRRCTACHRVHAQFVAQRAALRNSLEMDDDAWRALELEMRANVRLGLAAGALTETAFDAPVVVRAVPRWRWAAVAVALVFVWSAGLLLRTAPPEIAHARAPQADSMGYAVLPAAGGNTQADFTGAVHSREIDGETGQVTLQQVYAQ